MIRTNVRARGRLSLALFAALIAAPAACGPFHRGSSPEAQIVFVNESIDQADVYAAGPDGNAIRIGTVFGGRTETLRVPSSIVSQGGTISLTARILADGSVGSGAFTLNSGDTMRVRLPPDKRSLVVLPDR
jgi:hypothetical protein